jgi:hypothetical protein
VSPDTDTDTDSLTPGITPTEANLITAAAHRFLDHNATGHYEITMATITHQTGTLFTPYTPANIGKYNCGMPDKTHWCV